MRQAKQAAIVFSFGAQSPARYSYAEKNDFTWNDLKGFPDVASPFAANLNTGLSHSYSLDNKGNLVENSSMVTAYFYPKLSWYKSKEVNADLLNHERLHFKITELYARKLRMEMTEFRFTQHAKKEIGKIYAKIEDARKKMQMLFDKATRHGLDTEQERLWSEKVECLLAKY